MSSHDDLPLFRWTPPSVEVIPFPMIARVGKIRRAAEVLAGSTKKAARAYWRQVTGPVEKQLRDAGVAEDVITAELAAFRQAVEAEMARRYGRPARIDGGAA